MIGLKKDPKDKTIWNFWSSLGRTIFVSQIRPQKRMFRRVDWQTLGGIIYPFEVIYNTRIAFVHRVSDNSTFIHRTSPARYCAYSVWHTASGCCMICDPALLTGQSAPRKERENILSGVQTQVQRRAGRDPPQGSRAPFSKQVKSTCPPREAWPQQVATIKQWLSSCASSDLLKPPTASVSGPSLSDFWYTMKLPNSLL